MELLQFLAEAAYLWSYRGKHDKAAMIFETLSVLVLGDPIGPLGLAETWMSQGKFREADKAADQATRATRIDRRTLAFAYKLRGKALLQLNKPKEAEKLLQRSADIDPKGPEGQSAIQLIQLATKLGILTQGPARK